MPVGAELAVKPNSIGEIMMRLRNLILYSMMIYVLSGALYAIPSSRPGMGAVPYTGGTTFRVWAPNATAVNVAGNFNGWSATAHPLYSESGGLWSVDVGGASLNQQYKYVITNNGTHWRVDPRARDVVNSTDNGIIVSTTYTWTPFTPPAWNEMVIYEMHIGTYNDPPAKSGHMVIGYFSPGSYSRPRCQYRGDHARRRVPGRFFHGIQSGQFIRPGKRLRQSRSDAAIY